MMPKWLVIAAVIALVGCSVGTHDHLTDRPGPRPAGSSTTVGVPGSAPPAAIACQDFQAASSLVSKAEAKGTNLGAIKTYGERLIKATKPLNSATPDPDPALASALNLAGAANLAIAVGYEPHGVIAAYKAATKDVGAVGADCAGLGY